MTLMKNKPGGRRAHFLLPRFCPKALARRLKSFRFMVLRTLLSFFAHAQNSTLFLSSTSALFAQKEECGRRGDKVPSQVTPAFDRWLLPFLRRCILFVSRPAAGFNSRPPAASKTGMFND